MAKKEQSKSADPKATPKIIQFDSTLKCVLTDAELQTKGAQLADAIDEGARIEEEFAEVKNGFKGRIDGAKGRAAALASTVRAKAEYRSVKCHRVYEFNDGVVREYRTDTGEVINEREMTDSDRQQYLPLEERK
jgi:hypothetical protein